MYFTLKWQCHFCLHASLTLEPVIIRSSGGDVKDGSIINYFVDNGTHIKLSLTCTSVYQNEILEWIELSSSGTVKQEYSNNSHSSNITFVNPSNNLTFFRCKSKSTSFFKNVSITKRKYMSYNKTL